jgi:hypothetical protein
MHTAPVPSRAEQLLLEHPGDAPMLVTRIRAPVARELMASGLVTCEARRNGALAISLTEAGRRKKSALEAPPRPLLASPAAPRSARARAAQGAPGALAGPEKQQAPPSFEAAERHADASDARRTPATQRVPSLDDIFSARPPGPAPADRPATVADLEALEARLVARFEQLLASHLASLSSPSAGRAPPRPAARAAPAADAPEGRDAPRRRS